ncbi:MAG: hypothetical protein KA436_07105 [Oligoflexales bacterium]|nr:hypothetical protein [Oligoflexales bacterium]
MKRVQSLFLLSLVFCWSCKTEKVPNPADKGGSKPTATSTGKFMSDALEEYKKTSPYQNPQTEEEKQTQKIVEQIPTLDEEDISALAASRSCSQIQKNIQTLTDNTELAQRGSESSTATSTSTETRSRPRQSRAAIAYTLLAFGGLGILLGGANAIHDVTSSTPDFKKNKLLVFQKFASLGLPLGLAIAGGLLLNDKDPDSNSLDLIQGIVAGGAGIAAISSFAVSMNWAYDQAGFNKLSQNWPDQFDNSPKWMPQNQEEAEEIIVRHINERFDELETQIREQVAKGKRVSVTIPDDPDNEFLKANQNIHHALGVGLAQGQWGKNTSAAGTVPKLIQSRLAELIKKTGVTFVGRQGGERKLIRLSPASASEVNFQVWGANAGNWNYPDGTKMKDGFGGGQAKSIKEQKAGIFGIVTTPVAGLAGIDAKTNREWASRFLDRLDLTEADKSSLNNRIREAGRITHNFRSASQFVMLSQLYAMGETKIFEFEIDHLPFSEQKYEKIKNIFKQVVSRLSDPDQKRLAAFNQKAIPGAIEPNFELEGKNKFSLPEKFKPGSLRDEFKDGADGKKAGAAPTKRQSGDLDSEKISGGRALASLGMGIATAVFGAVVASGAMSLSEESSPTTVLANELSQTLATCVAKETSTGP